MSFSGALVQNAIYIAGEPHPLVTADDWEAAARERLDPAAFGYIAGGAGSERTMRANLDAFERRPLRPRMLAGNDTRDVSVEVLGTRSPAPFLLAPIGVLSIAHPDGELAVARAARDHAHLFVFQPHFARSLSEGDFRGGARCRPAHFDPSAAHCRNRSSGIHLLSGRGIPEGISARSAGVE